MRAGKLVAAGPYPCPMSSAYYLLAHRVLPMRASLDPLGTWGALSGSDWSMWLARASAVLGVSLRGVGVDGAIEGRAVHVEDGVAMVAVTFPVPTGAGEPYFAILARAPGDAAVRSFVFEMGIPEGPAPRVVMAEWRIQSADDMMRVRYDADADASLAACLRRTARAMRAAPAPSAPTPTPTPMPTASSWPIVGAMLGVVALGALAIAVLAKM